MSPSGSDAPGLSSTPPTLEFQQTPNLYAHHPRQHLLGPYVPSFLHTAPPKTNGASFSVLAASNSTLPKLDFVAAPTPIPPAPPNTTPNRFLTEMKTINWTPQSVAARTLSQPKPGAHMMSKFSIEPTLAVPVVPAARSSDPEPVYPPPIDMKPPIIFDVDGPLPKRRRVDTDDSSSGPSTPRSSTTPAPPQATIPAVQSFAVPPSVPPSNPYLTPPAIVPATATTQSNRLLPSRKVQTPVTKEVPDEFVECDPEDLVEQIGDAWSLRFKCKICEHDFPKKHTCITHIKNHLGKKPFLCDFENCGMSFVREHDRKRHQMTHTGVRPYECPCGKQFSRQDALRRHSTYGRCPIREASEGIMGFIKTEDGSMEMSDGELPPGDGRLEPLQQEGPSVTNLPHTGSLQTPASFPPVPHSVLSATLISPSLLLPLQHGLLQMVPLPIRKQAPPSKTKMNLDPMTRKGRPPKPRPSAAVITQALDDEDVEMKSESRTEVPQSSRWDKEPPSSFPFAIPGIHSAEAIRRARRKPPSTVSPQTPAAPPAPRETILRPSPTPPPLLRPITPQPNYVLAGPFMYYPPPDPYPQVAQRMHRSLLRVEEVAIFEARQEQEHDKRFLLRSCSEDEDDDEDDSSGDETPVPGSSRSGSIDKSMSNALSVSPPNTRPSTAGERAQDAFLPPLPPPTLKEMFTKSSHAIIIPHLSSTSAL